MYVCMYVNTVTAVNLSCSEGHTEVHPSDTPTEEITASILLKNMSPVPKTHTKCSIEEMATISYH